MKFLSMLKYPFLSGIFLPFKIWVRTHVKIRSRAEVRLAGRVSIGNPDRGSAVVSRLPVNIYFGKNSRVNIGHSLSIGSGVNIIVKDQGELRIGNGTYLTSDMHIEVVSKVHIGDNCAISWGVTIIDDNHHDIVYSEGKKGGRSGQVSIGNKVWIGCNTTILKDTFIGDNCIVAAGSIVKGTFPDHSLIAGNPAKVVRQIIGWN